MSQNKTNRSSTRRGMRSRWGKNERIQSIASQETTRIGEIQSIRPGEMIDSLPSNTGKTRENSKKKTEDTSASRMESKVIVEKNNENAPQNNEEIESKEAVKQEQVDIQSKPAKSSAQEDVVTLSSNPFAEKQQKSDHDELAVVELIGERKRQQQRKDRSQNRKRNPDTEPQKRNPRTENSRPKNSDRTITVDESKSDKNASQTEWKPNRNNRSEKPQTKQSVQSTRKPAKKTGIFAKVREIISGFFIQSEEIKKEDPFKEKEYNSQRRKNPNNNRSNNRKKNYSKTNNKRNNQGKENPHNKNRNSGNRNRNHNRQRNPKNQANQPAPKTAE